MKEKKANSFAWAGIRGSSWTSVINMVGRLKLWLAGIGAAAIALLSIWFGGKKSGQTAAKVEKLNEYIETRKRMDEVDSDTANSSREWLRERGER